MFIGTMMGTIIAPTSVAASWSLLSISVCVALICGIALIPVGSLCGTTLEPSVSAIAVIVSGRTIHSTSTEGRSSGVNLTRRSSLISLPWVRRRIKFFKQFEVGFNLHESHICVIITLLQIDSPGFWYGLFEDSYQIIIVQGCNFARTISDKLVNLFQPL